MIVTRGLGRGTIGALVAGGLCVSLGIIVVPPAEFDKVTWLSGFAHDKGKLVELVQTRQKASVQLSAVKAKSLIYSVTAKGGGKATLLDLHTGSLLHSVEAAGSSRSLALLVNEQSQLGQLFAKGVQDLSDEEIALLILSVLDL